MNGNNLHQSLSKSFARQASGWKCGLAISLIVCLLDSTAFAQAAVATGMAGAGANATVAGQGVASGANGIFGGQMAQSCKNNPVSCVMAAAAVAQIVMMMGSSSGASKAGDAMTGVGTGTGLTYGNTGSDGTTNPFARTEGTNGADGGSSLAGGAANTTAQNTLDNLKSALAATGTKISADGKTVTVPDGRSVPIAAAGSAGDLSAAGFSAGEISAGMSAAKLAADKASKIQAMKVDTGGGGGGDGGGGSKSAAADSPDFASMMRGMNGGKAAKKASVAGMSKKLGADNIGVAGDDIFEMITRRYKARDTNNAFFK